MKQFATIHLFFLLLLLVIYHCHAFLHLGSSSRSHNKNHYRPTTTTTRRYNFFKDLVDGAFQNDATLSTTENNKGMIEGPNSVDPDSIAAPTEVQRAWRERRNVGTGGGVVDLGLLENTKFALDLYLAGIPEEDPSNNLYGSKVNISNRNKQLGIDLPKEPNAQVEIIILPNGVCRVLPSALTTGETDGQWKVNDDQTELRFSMDVLGYSRTIQTKGSIEKIYWSDQPTASRQTTSTYEIPPGMVYGDIKIGNKANRPGVIDLKGDGILRVEKRTGLLGAGTKLVVCGKFTGKTVYDTPVANKNSL